MTNKYILTMPAELNDKLIKKSFVKQYSEFYCGLACLTSIVRYYGGETKQERLREMSGTSFDGTSLLGLCQAARKLGFDADGYEAEAENLKELSEPTILHIITKDEIEHFVVCYGYNNGNFIIGDPASGLEQYSEKKLKSLWKSKYLLKLTPGNGFISRKTESKRKWLWFAGLIKDDYPVLGIAAFLGVIISMLSLALAMFVQKLIDDILPGKDIKTLILGLAILGGLLLASGLIGYARSVLLVRQGKDMNNRLISSFFGKLLFLRKSFFDSSSTGDFIGRLNDTQRIQSVVVNLSSQVVIDILIVIVSVIYIFSISAPIGFLSLLTIPVFGLLAWRYNQQIINAQREVMQSYATTEGKFIDTIGGINTIKTYNKENLFARVVNYIYGLYMDKVYNLGIIGAKMNLWIAVLSVLFTIGIISLASHLVLTGLLLLGQMMAIVTIISRMATSVLSVAMANIELQEARIAFDRMYEFAADEPEYVIEESSKNKVQQDIEVNELEISGLSFRFPGKSLLLDNIHFSVKKGEVVTFFGEIGCGKSTLIDILQRFHSFESGEIKVNGNDWGQISTVGWRHNIAVVSQHIQLFNNTVIENIGLDEKTDYDKIIKFCKEYGFEEFILEFQQDYATIINENSTNLSGGQRQLIALARAIYSKPRILLLDEATAAMGRRTEHFVIKLINRLKKDMVIIFVTHRPQLARHTDRIYVIEDKTISGSGSHEELVKSNKFYHDAFSELAI